MVAEEFIPPEARQIERVLKGTEREKFIKDLGDYIEGLEAALADPDLSEENRAEIEEQLIGLRDSHEEIQKGREIRVKE